MKKISPIIIVILIICLFCGCQTPPPAVVEDDDSPITGGEKALIFLPGIMGSQIYNSETGVNLWDFFDDEELDNCTIGDTLMTKIKEKVKTSPMKVIKILNDLLEQNDESILIQMLSDEDGELLYETTQAYPVSDTRRRFGGFSSYKETVEALEEEFGDEYTVITFNYNWIEDIRLSADKLEKFIVENNYTDIALVSHSMGGLVASAYLAKKNNRRRVEKNVMINSPLYGAVDALDVLESNDYFSGYLDSISGILSLISFGGLGDALAKMLDDIKNGTLVSLLSNTTTISQLLPSAEFVSLYPSSFDQSTLNSVYDLYASRPWAVKKGGEIKGTLTKYQGLRDYFYVDVNGEKKFSTELVDSYYIAGTSYRTTCGAKLNKQNKLVYSYTYEGDGTVTVRSATLGKEIDNKKVFCINGTHSMGNVLKGECKDLVFSILHNEKK